jgi:hypothetical protein
MPRSPARLRGRPATLPQRTRPHPRAPLDPAVPVHLDWDGPMCGDPAARQLSKREDDVTCKKCLVTLRGWRHDLRIE